MTSTVGERSRRRSTWWLRAGLLGAALVLLLAVLGLLARFGAWMLSSESVDPPKLQASAAPRVTRVTPASAPTAVAAPSEGAPKAKPVQSADPLRGFTKFQRRLAAGERLRTIRDDLEDDAIDFETAALRIRALVPALLRADGYGRRQVRLGEQTSRGEVDQVLTWLTRPPRQVGALTLAGPASLDPLSDVRTVRAWVADEKLPVEEVASATRLMDQIADVLGAPVEPGFDVLVTPDQGADVFPLLRRVWWSVGTYYHADDFATVRSTLPADFRAEVLQHELIHAYTRRHIECGSRLVSEGLAEYLRYLEPDDDGFNIPPERMRDNFTALLERFDILRARRLDVGQIRPARLIQLSPKEFYHLRYVSYLIGQASLAYIGGDVVQQSLSRGSDAGIVKAIREMHWRGFLQFLKAHSAGGVATRSMVLRDGAPIRTSSGDTGTQTFLAAVERLGVDVGPDVDLDLPELDVVDHLAVGGRVEHVLQLLRDASVRFMFYSDRSAAMDKPIELAPTDPRLRDALARIHVTTKTGRGFADGLYAGSRAGRLSGHRAIDAKLRMVWSKSQHVAYPYDPRPFPRKLARLLNALAPHPDRIGVVVCVASRWSAKQEKAALEVLRDADTPDAMLIVDLSDGTGDARRLAELFHVAYEGRGNVAYWNPRKPLPR